MVSFTAAGTCVIDANQARQRQLQRGAPGPAVVHRRQGQPDDQLHLDGPPPVTVGGATYTPTATATSGLAVAFTLDATSTVCTL